MSAQRLPHSEGNGKIGKTKMACGFTVAVSDEFKQFLCQQLGVDGDHFDYLTSINVAVFFSREHGLGPAERIWGNRVKMPHHCKSSVEVYQWWLKKDRTYKRNGETQIPLLRLFVSNKKDLIVGKFDCGDRNHCYGFFLNEKNKPTTFIKQRLDLSQLDDLGMKEIALPKEFTMAGIPYSV